jgi:hypothetical protein
MKQTREERGVHERKTLTHVNERRSKGVEWIKVDKDGDRWLAVVNTVMNHRIS